MIKSNVKMKQKKKCNSLAKNSKKKQLQQYTYNSIGNKTI